MIDSAPRPRSATEIVDGAFLFLRGAPTQFLLATAAVIVPWSVVSIAIGAVADRPVAALLVAASSFIVTIVAGAASNVMAAELYLGRDADAVASLHLVARRFPTVLWAAFLKVLFNALGFLMLGIGMLYTWSRTVPMAPAMMIEGVGAGRAFQRSSELSVGNKRWILKSMLLVIVIYFVVSLAGGAVELITDNHVIVTLAQALVSLLLTPFYAVVETLIYYDLRVRMEGLDLEIMADDLETPNQPQPAV